MAWVYTEKTVADTSAAFTEIIAQLAAAGWSLVDDIDTESKVYSSQGETGFEIKGYIHIYVSSSTIYTQAYLYWDTGTHTGTCTTYNSTSSRIVISSSLRIYIMGSKDLFFIKPEGVYYSQVFGHVPGAYYSKILTTLTSGATAGDGATLTVGDSSNFVEESEYQIVGLSEGRDTISVSTIPDATHVVVLNLPRNYASGASIGITPMMFVCSASNYSTNVDPLCHFDAVGAAAYSQKWVMTYFIQTAYADPSKRTDRYILQPISFLEASNESIVGYCGENIFYAPSGTNDDLFGVKAGKPINGDVGSASLNTLTDGNKTWSTNEHIGRLVVLTDGLGAGQVRTISSNTATQVTLSTPWTTTPDVTTTYSVVDDVYVYVAPWTFVFKVVSPLH